MTDRPLPTPPSRGLDDLLDAIEAVRGVEADRAWASGAVVALLLDDVSETATRRALGRVLEAMRATGEGPEALYGRPQEFAEQVRTDALEAGEPLADSTPDASWRDVPVIGFTVAAVTAVLFFLLWLLSDGLTTDYTWGLVLAPGLMGVIGVAVMVAWERLLLRTSRLVAGLVTVAVFGTAVVALAWWLVEVNSGTHLATGSTFWMLALVPAYGGLAWLADRLLPERPRRTAPGSGRPAPDGGAAPLDDDEWAHELAGTLRLRMDMGEERVRETVREARAHAAEAGRPLAEEFGSPAQYAARFSRDTAGAARRTAWIFTALTALGAVSVVGGALEGDRFGWPAAWLGACAVAAALRWRDYARARRRDGAGRR